MVWSKIERGKKIYSNDSCFMMCNGAWCDHLFFTKKSLPLYIRYSEDVMIFFSKWFQTHQWMDLFCLSLQETITFELMIFLFQWDMWSFPGGYSFQGCFLSLRCVSLALKTPRVHLGDMFSWWLFRCTERCKLPRNHRILFFDDLFSTV